MLAVLTRSLEGAPAWRPFFYAESLHDGFMYEWFNT